MSDATPPDLPSTELVPASPDAHLPARPVQVTELVEQASETVLGFALLLGDGVRAVAQQVVSPAALPTHPDEEPGPVTTGLRVGLGLALDVQHRALGATEAVVQVVGPTARWLVSNPLLRPAVAPMRRRLDDAYEAGLERERQARSLASRTSEQTVSLAVPVVLDTVDLGPVIDQVIGEIDLGPMISKVMGEIDLASIVDDVMGELDLGPIVEKVLAQLDMQGLIDQIVGEMQMSSVVMSATGGITEDVLGGVRDRSADGDALVDRIAARLRRRTVEELPPLAYPGTAESETDPEPDT